MIIDKRRFERRITLRIQLRIQFGYDRAGNVKILFYFNLLLIP